MEQTKKTKFVIIVFACLLGLSLLVLGTSSKLASAAPAGATESDTTQSTSTTTETTIELYSTQPEENTPFQVSNMFPGDSETKRFRVQVSYHDNVTVHYKATVRSGYEKLAEVLKVKVNLLTTGETLYDGLMKDMPGSLTHELASTATTTDELYYEITAYLDTSVGNEYQNKDLIADFTWWVEETENLEPLPKTGDSSNVLESLPETGDSSNVLLWACVAVASIGMIILLLVAYRRKGDKKNA